MSQSPGDGCPLVGQMRNRGQLVVGIALVSKSEPRFLRALTACVNLVFCMVIHQPPEYNHSFLNDSFKLLSNVVPTWVRIITAADLNVNIDDS